MRQELLEPLKDFPLFLVARELVLRIYMCLQGGADYSEQLAELNAICKRRLTACDMEAAAELIEPDEWAFGLLVDQVPTPTDLTYAEMLELVEKLKANAAENGLQAGYWEHCLTVNTGDSNFASLLQGGAELYFRDGISRWLTAKEILDTALATSGKAIA